MVYGHRGLGPRRYRSPAFDERADMALVALVRCCKRLTRLVVRDRVSTATLIVIAAEGYYGRQPAMLAAGHSVLPL